MRSARRRAGALGSTGRGVLAGNCHGEPPLSAGGQSEPSFPASGHGEPSPSPGAPPFAARGSRRWRSPLAASFLLLAAATWLVTSPALAVRPVVWTESPAGLLRGDSRGVALTGQGALVLAPRADDLVPLSPGKDETISDPLVWCQALAPDGSLILGTGHSGKVLRIDERGKVALLAQLPEPEVTALLVSRGGAIYAGTSPGGALYKVGRDGEASELFDPEERYIWSLAEDGAGWIYAGTGERGKVFQISTKGEGSVLYDSREPHITALAVDHAGMLIAGSDGSGKIYRIDPQKKTTTVLFDSAYREVSDLAIDGAGQIFAAAVPSGVGEIPPPAPRLLMRPPEEEGRVPSREEISQVSPEPSPRPREREVLEAELEGVGLPGAAARQTRERGGTVFRILTGGSVEEVWKSSEEVPYALAATQDGTVYVGTGEPARLLRLEEKGRAVVIAKFPQAQITDLALDPSGRLFAVTSNSGAAYRMSHDLSESGTYESEVRDAGVMARWGRIAWDATAGSGERVEVQTRTGNSSLPDETWSEWSPTYADPEGSEIASPSARFVQWKVRLVRATGSSSSPLVKTVRLTYLPHNRPPRIRELKMLSRNEVPAPAESSGETVVVTSESGARPAGATPGSGAAGRRRIVVWHAEDPDDDPLVYRVFLQREGADGWLPLGTDVTDSTASFDESVWPEGRYRVKAVASDAAANFAGDGLEAETIVEGSIIDLSPPGLEWIGGTGEGRVRASDALSPIESAEILKSDRALAAAKPLDGVLDSRTETLQIDVPAGVSRDGLVLRVRDAAGNETRLDLSSRP